MVPSWAVSEPPETTMGTSSCLALTNTQPIAGHSTPGQPFSMSQGPGAGSQLPCGDPCATPSMPY